MESTAYTSVTTEPLGSIQAPLTPEELATLAAVAWGVDVLDHGLAVRLRALEAAHSDLVVCTEPKGKYPATGRIPYLGASATTAGRELLAKHAYITSADVEQWTTTDLITSSSRLGVGGAP